MKRILLISVSTVFLTICSYSQKNEVKLNKVLANEHLVQSVAWFQRSAEMQASYYQAFNFAKIALENNLNKTKSEKPFAVVIDIDETILDNSPFEVECIRSGKGYSKKRWREWGSMQKAQPLPGAVDFVHFAKAKNVEVFYISNRYIEEMKETVGNLQKFDFPNADTAHIFLRVDNSDKTKRRNIISSTHKIVLFVGDNLTDFSQIFAHRDSTLGFKIVDSLKNQFGVKFIILPNPMYGEWEKAIYGNTYKLSGKEKDKRRKDCLIGY